MLASEASQALGLSHCITAPAQKPGRRPSTPADSTPSSAASRQAMYRKKATPAKRMNASSTGNRSSSLCSPRPISSNSTANPTLAPLTCHKLGRQPKRAPLPSATRLTGPGVIEAARAKAAMEKYSSTTCVLLVASVAQVKDGAEAGLEQNCQAGLVSGTGDLR